MAKVRNFDEEYALKDREGLTFVLGGIEFHTKAVAPPRAFREEHRGLDAAVAFLTHCLIPEDREVFQKLVDDPDSGISAYQIDQVAAWVIEETSGRPTNVPDSSGSGAEATS